MEKCLLKKDLGEENFAEHLLKEAERIFEHGGDSIVLDNFDAIEKPEQTCTTICQYFLKGKCRFGENCFNLHEKLSIDNTADDEAIDTPSFEDKTKNITSKCHKSRNKVTGSEKPKKKSPMKTATDVINRIQWDEQLNPSHFTVGYLDRFLGIVENSFNSFDWEDVTSQDPTVLAIPKHRIQYFKFHDEILWDKNKRVDCVFGSTGSGMTIIDVIAKSNLEVETANYTENEETRNSITD